MRVSAPFRLTPAQLNALPSRTVSIELTAALTFQLFEVLAQPRPNHWARVWPTAVAVSRWLLECAPGVLPASAVELGCGMGLVSLTLAHLGVVIEGTDREPIALAFALKNAARNGLSGLTSRRVEWVDDVGLGVPTQLLVGSDVAYETGSPEMLFELIETGGLLAPGGMLVLGAPEARSELPDRFVRRLSDFGYVHHRSTSLVAWEGREESICVHTLVRPVVA